jgi:DNA-binding PadR family transcriptional regulator
MPIPQMTSLQYLTLAVLMDGELSGRRLRENLAEKGHSPSAPGFYQFMARLEETGFITGRYNQKVLDGQIYRERVYSITSSGTRSWEAYRDFITSHGRLGLQGA